MAGWNQSYVYDLFAFSTVKAEVSRHPGSSAVVRGLQVLLQALRRARYAASPFGLYLNVFVCCLGTCNFSCVTQTQQKAQLLLWEFHLDGCRFESHILLQKCNTRHSGTRSSCWKSYSSASKPVCTSFSRKSTGRQARDLQTNEQNQQAVRSSQASI